MMKATDTIRIRNEKGERIQRSRWFKGPIFVSYQMNFNTKDSEIKLIYTEDRHITNEEHRILNEIVRTIEERGEKYKMKTVTVSLVIGDETPKHTKEVLKRIMKYD